MVAWVSDYISLYVDVTTYLCHHPDADHTYLMFVSKRGPDEMGTFVKYIIHAEILKKTSNTIHDSACHNFRATLQSAFH